MSNQLSFFNTTQLTGEVLQTCIEQAKNQDELVMELFNARKTLSPSDCWQLLVRTGKIEGTTPLTSIRRSITVLTKKGKLKLTDKQKVGIFGRPEGIWELNFFATDHTFSHK